MTLLDHSGRPRRRLRRARPHALVGLALTVCATSGLAQAQAEPPQPAPEDSAAAVDSVAANRDLARSIAVTGREAFNASDYETALALFRRAYALFPAPTLILYEARSLRQLGMLLEAREAYVKTANSSVAPSDPPQFRDAIDQARQEARELEALIPTLTLEVVGVSNHDPNLEVSINGRAIGAAQLGRAQRVNPGRYRVRGSVGSGRSDEAETVLTEGQSATLVLKLAAPNPSPPPPGVEPGALPDADTGSASSPGVATYVAAGVGVLGVGAGVVSGLMATAKHREALSECPEFQCQEGSPGVEAARDFRSLKTVSTVSYAVGAAGLVTGGILWLTGVGASSEHLSASVEPWGTRGCRVGVSGRF